MNRCSLAALIHDAKDAFGHFEGGIGAVLASAIVAIFLVLSTYGITGFDKTYHILGKAYQFFVASFFAVAMWAMPLSIVVAIALVLWLRRSAVGNTTTPQKTFLAGMLFGGAGGCGETIIILSLTRFEYHSSVLLVGIFATLLASLAGGLIGLWIAKDFLKQPVA